MHPSTRFSFVTLLLLGSIAGLNATEEKGSTLADFEGADFGDWVVSGEAFGSGPVHPDTAEAAEVSGYEGQGYASSNTGGYALEGTLTSPEFTIEKPYLNFLMAGGDTNDIYVILLVKGVTIKSAIPTSKTRLDWTTWDVTTLVGQTAQIQIVDDRSGHPEGYLFVDSIEQSNQQRAAPLATRTMNIDILSAKAFNPDPKHLPILGLWKRGKEYLVSAQFPELPGFTCDSWCYEIADIELIGAGAKENGILQMQHRVSQGEHVFRLKTKVIPSAGAVEFRVTAAADEAGESLPDELPIPNLCFQLRRAPQFKSDRPESDNYPEFVSRCFIYTDAGRTYLNHTERLKIPARPANDKENNPPWVQVYVGVWKTPVAPKPDSWSDTSPDRYTVPVIGTVSRDGKHLVALADDTADLMCQAWHDCLHTRPKWLPVDAPPAEQSWRMKVYLMENDPDALLARVREDFPKLDEPAKKRVPLEQ